MEINNLNPHLILFFSGCDEQNTKFKIKFKAKNFVFILNSVQCQFMIKYIPNIAITARSPRQCLTGTDMLLCPECLHTEKRFLEFSDTSVGGQESLNLGKTN